MTRLTPQLADFLSGLIEIDAGRAPMPQRAAALSDQFYGFLHAIGVEHCNYGLFGVEQGSGQVREFSGSLLPEPFQEEFVADMAADDYILLRAQGLSAARPVQRFDIGLDTLDEIEAFHAPSRQVSVECARQGIRRGAALIGLTPGRPGDSGERYFGFAFAGDEAGGREVRARFDELQIAAFALMDRLMPKMVADQSGFAYDLSAREQNILGALANGEQRAQIAHRYNISLPTVDMHLANLRKKLGAQTLAEAVARGFRFGLL